MTEQPREDTPDDYLIRSAVPAATVVEQRGEPIPSIAVRIEDVRGRRICVYMPTSVAYQMLDELPQLLVEATEEARRRMGEG